MNSKWTVYMGVLIPIVALIVGVTTPEVRCFLRLQTTQCSKDAEKTNVELIVKTDSQEPLSDVNVEFKSEGPPGTALTDSNGYTTIKIPSTTDVQVTLSKEGFTTKSYVIDLRKDSVVTRTYMLKKKSRIQTDLACYADTCTGRDPVSNACNIGVYTMTHESVSFPNLGENFKNLRLEINTSNQCHTRWVKLPQVPGATIYFEGKDKKQYESLPMNDDLKEPQVTGMLSRDIADIRACVSHPTRKEPQCTGFIQ